MNIKMFFKSWLIAAVVIIFSISCAPQKHITYLQGVEVDYSKIIDNDLYEMRIQPDDQLGIMVNYGRDAELEQLFNLPMVSYQSGSRLGTNYVMGYLVDKDGNIDFPELGKIKIVGMTRSELTDYIKKRLIDDGLLIDPIITVQFLNFQVSVIGEVARPGAFDVTSDRITLFDALSRAGDLTIYGQRDNVRVIREVNGVRTIAEVNLLNADILDSPYYYLQQNDIVYVQPNKAKAGQREINSNRTIGTYASIMSVILSVLSLIL